MYHSTFRRRMQALFCGRHGGVCQTQQIKENFFGSLVGKIFQSRLLHPSPTFGQQTKRIRLHPVGNPGLSFGRSAQISAGEHSPCGEYVLFLCCGEVERRLGVCGYFHIAQEILVLLFLLERLPLRLSCGLSCGQEAFRYFLGSSVWQRRPDKEIFYLRRRSRP